VARSETWRDQRERRFRLGPVQVPEVLAELAGRLPLVSYVPGSTRTFVVTTYLDSPARDYLAMVEQSSGHTSLKVRVREYMAVHEDGQAGRLTPAATCFLERKERVGDLRIKQRVELPRASVAAVLRREVELRGEETVVSALRSELDARDLEPVLVSCYRRSVFGADRGLRVTFDEDLGFHAPPAQLYPDDRALVPEVLGPRVAAGPAHLLEVKEPSGNQTPAWLVTLLGELESAERFSKFRDGMRSLAGADRGRDGARRRERAASG
jgi:hypothetical protein